MSASRGVGCPLARGDCGIRIGDWGFRKAEKNLCDLGVSAVKHQWVGEFFFLTAEAQRTRRGLLDEDEDEDEEEGISEFGIRKAEKIKGLGPSLPG